LSPNRQTPAPEDPEAASGASGDHREGRLHVEVCGLKDLYKEMLGSDMFGIKALIFLSQISPEIHLPLFTSFYQS
jgi:hypothetical protein